MGHRVIDQEAQLEIEQRVLYYATIGRARLDQRIARLDEEWDFERWLLALGGALSVLGMLAGGRRKHPVAVISGLFGAWVLTQPLEDNPATELLRRVGIRSRQEIETEKVRLMAVRGDMGVIRDDLQEELVRALSDLESDATPPIAH